MHKRGYRTVNLIEVHMYLHRVDEWAVQRIAAHPRPLTYDAYDAAVGVRPPVGPPVQYPGIYGAGSSADRPVQELERARQVVTREKSVPAVRGAVDDVKGDVEPQLLVRALQAREPG